MRRSKRVVVKRTDVRHRSPGEMGEFRSGGEALVPVMQVADRR
jgi:hypothetical protein